MGRWLWVVVALGLGAGAGLLTAEKLHRDRELQALAARVSDLEVRAGAMATRERVETLDERVAGLETELVAAAEASRAARAALGRVDELALDSAPVRGPADAPVTIVAFSDFQCPFCSRVTPTLERLLEHYPQSVRLAFKHFPLAFHADAPLAHRASIAAGNQGRFWEMHDRIFLDSRNLSRAAMLAHARALALDMPRFTADLDTDETRRRLQADIAEGRRLRVTGTPTFFINGRAVSGAQPYENFRALVERELAGS